MASFVAVNLSERCSRSSEKNSSSARARHRSGISIGEGGENCSISYRSLLLKLSPSSSVSREGVLLVRSMLSCDFSSAL